MNPLVSAICIGQPRPFRGEEQSAFAKQPVDGPVTFGPEGILGDAQADRKHHGGPHMAVHLYPLAHHAFWETELGGHELLAEPGAFGSNLAVDTITETEVMLGDRFRLGTALLEVSQPRLPCWKIEHRFGCKGMVRTIIRTARCGWYFRVIEQGMAQAGDSLERIETGCTPWTVAEVFAEIANPKAGTTSTRLAAMARSDVLSPSWREAAREKAAAL
ncbi:MOSC domain-containing protein [Altererythrobacter sp. H2]|uniref:MOSC domain-containing protein n=1 Tax=Altererythrobacter sp. H2 TaxID=3108391 RepID=UPI002B4C0E83|nr:MOSC domain-containing protein [Altererythrobacter sp. H2]WRK95062.1 MOSC domain-containing protein [Altererythrobacter sp. H2]